LQRAGEQHVHNDRPAVGVQLQDILASKGRRGREIKCDALVKGSAIGIAETSQRDAARRRHITEQFLRDLRNERA
jgi:hypothetical protein